VDLLGLAGDAATLVGPHVVEGPHVVQTVGQLDEDHPQIAGHRHQHLAEVFGLGFFVGLELDLVELGDPIHQLGRGAEALGDLGLGDVGVLHHVVQEGGAQGLGVQVPAGEDLGDGDRMGDVGFAALAQLPGVGVGREVVGGFDAARSSGRR
jgi:hypothetical protein